MSTSEVKPPELVADPGADETPVEIDSNNQNPLEQPDKKEVQALEHTPKEAKPVAGGHGRTEVEQVPELSSIVQVLGVLSEAIIAEFREPPAPLTPWQRMRNGFVGFAKDVGPFVTGLGSITVSIVVGLLTVTVTAAVAFFNYQVNSKQAQATEMNLKTAALTDFIEPDDGKRTLAAIKLAAHGEAALPAIKLTLGVDHEGIRTGGVQAAKIMYESRPDLRSILLAEMSRSFRDSNPILRRGVLEFYTKVASQMEKPEQQLFLNELKATLGANAKSCSNHDEALVREAATFLSKIPFPEVTELLLDIARNCPHRTHEDARIQAINMLQIVVEDQKLPLSTRQMIIGSLNALKLEGADEFNASIETAIEQIQSVPNP